MSDEQERQAYRGAATIGADVLHVVITFVATDSSTRWPMTATTTGSRSATGPLGDQAVSRRVEPLAEAMRPTASGELGCSVADLRHCEQSARSSHTNHPRFAHSKADRVAT